MRFEINFKTTKLAIEPWKVLRPPQNIFNFKCHQNPSTLWNFELVDLVFKTKVHSICKCSCCIASEKIFSSRFFAKYLSKYITQQNKNLKFHTLFFKVFLRIDYNFEGLREVSCLVSIGVRFLCQLNQKPCPIL